MIMYHGSTEVVDKFKAFEEVYLMDREVLERVYQENLEERIIAYLSETRDITLEKAMDAYYHSKLADKIHRGVEGIQYLDYKVLVQLLCETEKELVCEISVDIAEIDVTISES